MSISDVRLDLVSESTLRRLVDNQVRESLTVDYKRDLPGGDTKAKREFLKDVTAFANAEGGDLLFGVDEDDGVASAIPGVRPASLDAEIQRISSLLRDGVDPRLHGVNIHPIPLDSGAHVVVVRVPPSIDAPHMVQLGGYRQFFTRNPSGNHPMSTHEVRHAVLRTQDWKTRAEGWRRGRAGLLAAGDGPLVLRGRGAVVLHVVPIRPADRMDLASPSVTGRLSQLPNEHSGGGGWNERMTFDGWLLAPGFLERGGSTAWYRLWFHDGPIEMVLGDLIRRRSAGDADLVSGRMLESFIQHSLETALSCRDVGGPSPPLLVMVTVVGVAGASLDAELGFGRGVSQRLDRADLLIPPLLMDREYDDLWPFLAPAINRIWQAAGRHCSPFLSADGRRRSDR